MHVACAAEGAYVRHSETMLRSVLTHAPGATIHYLLPPRVPAADRARVAQLGDVTFHEVADERVAGLPHDPRFTASMWLRVLLPELLAGVDRVLYLDVDTLVLGDLAPLWEADLRGNALGAVSTVFQANHRWHAGELGLAPREYFNSGVLLMDLDQMRRDATMDRVVDLVRGNAFEWPDQDALNLAFAGRWHHLHPRFNAQNGLYVNRDSAAAAFGRVHAWQARRRPVIRHFEGPDANKPWSPDCTLPHADQW